MKNRSFFVAGALLLASLFTTSCKELMSNFDEPVKSYLTAPADITLPTGDTYDLSKAVATINSDKQITFKSSDDNVVTVDENTGVVTAVADGEATIIVSVAASDNYQADSKEVKVAVKRPLTFEALEDGIIGVWAAGITLPEPIVYTIVNENGREKKEISVNGGYVNTSINVSKGDKVEFESANDHMAEQVYNSEYDYWYTVYVNIYSQMKCSVYGNVMSLITPDGNYHTNKAINKTWALSHLFTWDNYIENDKKYKLLLPATKLSDYCYQNMFNACYNLEEAPELPAEKTAFGSYAWMFQNCIGLKAMPNISAKEMGGECCWSMFYNCSAMETVTDLAATTLGTYCYSYMFQGCTAMKTAPALKATTLNDGCYSNMFIDCSGLIEGPALPAKELKPYCYQGLFNSCTNLTKAPAMSATKLAYGCCDGMFFNSGLTEAPALPVTELAPYCYEWMFEECSDLTKAPALPASTLEEGCYLGMFAGCESLAKAPDLKAETLVDYCYQEMFKNCKMLNYVKCLAKNCTYRSVYLMLLNAGTDESVTTRTLERNPDTYWNVIPAGYVTSYYLYVNEDWTITPPYSLEAPAAPTLAKAAPALEKVKAAPALSYSARQKAEMPARHQVFMNPEKPARFK